MEEAARKRGKKRFRRELAVVFATNLFGTFTPISTSFALKCFTLGGEGQSTFLPPPTAMDFCRRRFPVDTLLIYLNTLGLCVPTKKKKKKKKLLAGETQFTFPRSVNHTDLSSPFSYFSIPHPSGVVMM